MLKQSPTIQSSLAIEFEFPKPSAGYFAFNELQELNSGFYHDLQHALEVADLTAQLTQSLGRSKARCEFLKQVALVHDADPRPRGIPARVPATLRWMEQERTSLEQRFGWSQYQFKEAFALIARTDFPFDHTPRYHGTRFDGRSPVEIYREALWKLPRESRKECMADALILRFCDQIAAYLGSYDKCRASVLALVKELNNTGLALSEEDVLRQTPVFLNKVGTDLEIDQKLKTELNLAHLELPNRRQLLMALDWKSRIRLARNTLQLRLI